MSYYTIYYALLESKLFIILTKYILSERSDSRDSIFGGLFVIGVILTKYLSKKLNVVWRHPVAVYGMTP